MRASISLPGLFTPVEFENNLLVDGGLVNPVPVSMCRALGAQLVIAVDLNADLLGAGKPDAIVSGEPDKEPDSIVERIQQRLSAALSLENKDHDTPSVIDVVTASLNIMQVRISRSRLAGEPADAMITPRLAHFALLDFHRAAEAIEEGEAATERAMSQIKLVVGQ